MNHPIIGLAIGICIFGAIATSAYSHGDAQWIQDGGYLTEMNTPCCGTDDCHRIPAANVRPQDAGRYSVMLEDGAQIIGPKGVHRSQTPEYWICRFPKQPLRCLFVPFTGA